MNVPSILQGPSLTRLLQGAALGAVAAMVIGFNWGGWVTGSTAEKMAAEQSKKAVVVALAPGCRDKFMAQSDAVAQRVALQKSDSWRRSDLLPKELTTLPGQSYTDSDLARACSDLILKDKAAAN